MAICEVCGQEMKVSKSCVRVPIQLNGKDYDPIPYGKGPGEVTDRCPDCGVEVGGYHHPGCANEICPRCGKQVVTCNCEEGC